MHRRYYFAVNDLLVIGHNLIHPWQNEGPQGNVEMDQIEEKRQRKWAYPSF